MDELRWHKYPEEMPPADDRYLVVLEFDMNDGTKQRSVFPCSFSHFLDEVSPLEFNSKEYHRPGWFDTQPDYDSYTYYEIDNVIYWMPFPKAPED